MKLTDSQLVILSSAANREGGLLLPLPKSVKLNKGAAAIVLKSLLKHKLAAECAADRDGEAWREEKDGTRVGLVITDQALKAIGIDSRRETKAPNSGSGRQPPGEKTSSKAKDK